MAAATMARCLTPTCAMALRMKCTRQRCQAAQNTFFAAALMPSCASEMTSLTPRSPRAVSERRNCGPERLGFRRPDRHAEHLAASVRIDANSDYHGNGDDPAALAHLHVGGVDPQVGPRAFDRAIEERPVTRSSMSSHSRETWLFEMPVMPIALTRSSTERVETPCTYASWMTAISALSAVRRGSRNDGK